MKRASDVYTVVKNFNKLKDNRKCTDILTNYNPNNAKPNK